MKQKQLEFFTDWIIGMERMFFYFIFYIENQKNKEFFERK